MIRFSKSDNERVCTFLITESLAEDGRDVSWVCDCALCLREVDLVAISSQAFTADKCRSVNVVVLSQASLEGFLQAQFRLAFGCPLVHVPPTLGTKQPRLTGHAMRMSAKSGCLSACSEIT